MPKVLATPVLGWAQSRLILSSRDSLSKKPSKSALPSATCTFTLARGALLWQLAQSGTKGAKGHSGKEYDEHEKVSIFNSQFSLYPNPTTGHFNIEVSGARQVQVTIYNLQGKVITTYDDNDRDHYCFEGSLPPGNTYFATIATENDIQTIKLIIK